MATASENVENALLMKHVSIREAAHTLGVPKSTLFESKSISVWSKTIPD